mmetsp:Transcript_32964/g.65524  ORF Transcript_32964/g.65524 Transcript_32964/m.65524 type:complete len:963 (-) Transcript_32964:52-2940(-)
MTLMPAFFLLAWPGINAFAPIPCTVSRLHGLTPINLQHNKLNRRPQRSANSSLASASSSGQDIPRDILIVGGGLAGLSIAHHIASAASSPRHITILDRESPEEQKTKTVAGSFAAAGMLAPQSERLPAGPLLDICLSSRDIYGEWVKRVEGGARDASLGVQRRGGRNGGRENVYTGEGAKYLWELTGEEGILSSFDDGPSPPLEPWEVGYHSKGGFLAPAFAGDAVATWSPQPDSGKAYWLDEVQVRELEPMLHPQVIGGWWFPDDASVDARRLTCSLRASCAGLGVQMLFGEEYDVKSLEMKGGKCKGVHLANGKTYSPNSLIIANGSWMRHLLPIPVTPHKGQSFSLRMPSNSPPILSRVLFAQDTYIVPKADGRIIVGATVEPGKFDGDVTPSGLMHCLSEATRLVPDLADLPIEETWAGLRPTTPDKCPILGKSPQWENVYLAGGYWRNGVLLAPKTGQLIGDLVMSDGNEGDMSEKDQELLKAFSMERFIVPGGGKTLAANARYAATFYPVHKRSKSGVAAAVGTELGFYEGAAAAKEDRAKDRKAIFGSLDDEMEELERAAGMGKSDAEAFSLGNKEDGWMVKKGGKEGSLNTVDADPDAFTVAVLGDDDEDTMEYDSAETNESSQSPSAEEEKKEKAVDVKSDLSSIYEKIKANKAKSGASVEMGENPFNERPDPGFRIHFIDPETRDLIEVPPYTSPGEFHQMRMEGKFSSNGTAGPAASPDINHDGDEKPSFDGYQTIREAYGEGNTEEETAEATRKARMRNRVISSEIDESAIGVMKMNGSSKPMLPPLPAEKDKEGDEIDIKSDLPSLYEKIKSNKAKTAGSVKMGEDPSRERPDPGFRIHFVDPESRELVEVPPYTSPGEFQRMRLEQQENDQSSITSMNESNSSLSVDSETENHILEGDDGSDEKTYDGYQDIMSANSSTSREEELERMREARMRNRVKASKIEDSFQP